MSNGVISAEGRFVWFEYVSSDVAKAQGTFGELFNWTAKPVPMPGGDYVMIAAADGRTIGGYTAPPKKTPAAWTPYMRVANCADKAAHAETLGGHVIQAPIAIGDFATMALIADPHGGVFALWQPSRAEEAPEPGLGHFRWSELMSKDPAASAKFYAELGGMSILQIERGGAPYHVLRLGEEPRAGIVPIRGDLPHHWRPYVHVASVDTTLARAEKLGSKIASPPIQVPVGRIAVFVDAQGVATGVVQP